MFVHLISFFIFLKCYSINYSKVFDFYLMRLLRGICHFFHFLEQIHITKRLPKLSIPVQILFTSIHNTLSLNQESVFSLRKCQIQISLIFLPLEGSFPEKIFENFFT